MVDESTERVLLLWLAAELGALVVLAGLLAASVFGDSNFLSSVSRPVRIAALAFVVVELLIPCWVYVDLRRRTDDPGMIWLHAAGMPVVNLFGLLAYLEARRRERDE